MQNFKNLTTIFNNFFTFSLWNKTSINATSTAKLNTIPKINSIINEFIFPFKSEYCVPNPIIAYIIVTVWKNINSTNNTNVECEIFISSLYI